MSEPGSVTVLLRKAKAGDVKARADLRKRMAPFIRALAAPQVKGRVRQIGDADDVEASVAAVFFGRSDKDKLVQIDAKDRSHLKAHLVKATKDKATDYRRKAARRIDAKTETDLRGRRDADAGQPLDAEPAKDAEVNAVAVAEVLEGLPEDQALVAELLINGFSQREIAQKLGLNRYQVGKIVQELRRVLTVRRMPP